MIALPTDAGTNCWNRVGVWGDGSCPELPPVVHCHNCPVFSAAGRRFLDARSPEGYADEWAARLATNLDEAAADQETLLVFRIREEWLALPVAVLVEVIAMRPVIRVPHRAGLLAGMVNIRGELQLCVRMGQLLGIDDAPARPPASGTVIPRLIVIRNDGEDWVFAVDEVDQVRRFPAKVLGKAPATLDRASGKLTKGVYPDKGRSIGRLNEALLFQSLRTRLR
jgi:chemotaxis-related protein WspD